MKRTILGTMVDETSYEDATQRIILAARAGQGFAVSALAVDGVMAGLRDASHRARLNCFDLVAPDGRLIRWAMWWLHGVPLLERVYGPKLAMHVLRAAAVIGMPVFFYGSSQRVLDRMVANLQSHFPGLVVAGTQPSQPVGTPGSEWAEIASRVRSSGARILFSGLGSPEQERFAYEFRDAIQMPVLTVGAAFDYQADMMSVPPTWLQRARLQRLYRRLQHPTRMLRRLLILNPAYLILIALQWSGLWRQTPEGATGAGNRTDEVVNA